MPEINDLPDICILRIFGNFNFFERLKFLPTVCKKWQSLTEKSWDTITSLNLSTKLKSDAKEPAKLLDQIIVACFARLGTSLVDLNLGFCGSLLPIHLALIANRCPNIRRLRFAADKLSVDTISKLSSLEKLVSLSIEDCVFSQPEEASLKTVLASLKSLKAIRLWFCDLTGACFDNLKLHQPIRMLELNRCNKLEAGLGHVKSFLAENGSALLLLKITGVAIVSAFVVALPTSCQILERFWFDSFSPTETLKFDTPFPTLKAFYCHWKGLCNEALMTVVQQCKNLDTLHIPWTAVDDNGLIAILDLKNLKDLDLRQVAVSDGMMEMILKSFGKQLRCVDISGCKLLTSAVLEGIAKECTNLFMVDFHGCPGIDAETATKYRSMPMPKRRASVANKASALLADLNEKFPASNNISH